MRVLLTGATGTFGRYLARELLVRGNEVVAVARGRDDLDAHRRVLAAVRPAPLSALTTVAGDLDAPVLELARNASIRRCDTVVHSAASTAFDLPLAAARLANVSGTRHLLELADALPYVSSVGYIGTAFVAGRRSGRISEAELQHQFGFVNTYEQSKYEAELVARESALPVSIFRPSVVAEEEPSSELSALRFVLKLIARGLLHALPGPEDATLDVVGARDAAAAIVDLLLDQQPGGVFHIASGDDAPFVADLVAGCTNRRVTFLAADGFGRELDRLQGRSAAARRLYAPLASCVGVLAHPKIFDTSNATSALGRSVAQSDPVVLTSRTLKEAA